MTTKTFDDSNGAELADRTGYEAVVVLADGTTLAARHYADFDVLVEALKVAAGAIDIAAVTIRDRAKTRVGQPPAGASRLERRS